MAETILSPRQVNPLAVTETLLYAPPAGKAAVPRGVRLLNRHATDTLKYRVSVSFAGAVTTDKDYVAYDVPLGPKQEAIVAGIVLGPTDAVRVYSDLANLSAHLMGVERDVLSGVEDYRILGQLAPAAGSLLDLYRCAPGSFAVVSGFWVCNRSATPTTYSATVAPDDAADDPKHYLASVRTIGANDCERVMFTTGYTLDGADVVRVLATAATLSFGLFGYGSVHTPAGAATGWYGPPISLHWG